MQTVQSQNCISFKLWITGNYIYNFDKCVQTLQVQARNIGVSFLNRSWQLVSVNLTTTCAGATYFSIYQLHMFQFRWARWVPKKRRFDMEKRVVINALHWPLQAIWWLQSNAKLQHTLVKQWSIWLKYRHCESIENCSFEKYHYQEEHFYDKRCHEILLSIMYVYYEGPKIGWQLTRRKNCQQFFQDCSSIICC